MISHRTLVEASSTFHGSYNNGNGRSRVGVHEVLSEVGDIDVSAAAHQIHSKIEEDLESFDNKGAYWHTPVFKSLEDATEATGLGEHTIARIAMSEIDPEWVMQASSEEILAVAGIMRTCRAIAGQVHNAEMVAHSD